MLNSLITCLQIFGIGFSFGIIGPCFLACVPVMLTYVVGRKRAWPEVFKDILAFLFARLLAYVILGAIAGFSGAAIRRFASSNVSSYLQPLAGVVTIFFAILVLIGREVKTCACPTSRDKILNFGGIFAFGFLIGISPCAPLLALLFDIALMAKNIWQGMIYALSFGLGTLLSGLIAIGIIAGILAKVPGALIKSKMANIVFRIICAMLLIALGLGLILKTYRI